MAGKKYTFDEVRDRLERADSLQVIQIAVNDNLMMEVVKLPSRQSLRLGGTRFVYRKRKRRQNIVGETIGEWELENDYRKIIKLHNDQFTEWLIEDGDIPIHQ